VDIHRDRRTVKQLLHKEEHFNVLQRRNSPQSVLAD
jgi:hypothetical protein